MSKLISIASYVDQFHGATITMPSLKAENNVHKFKVFCLQSISRNGRGEREI